MSALARVSRTVVPLVMNTPSRLRHISTTNFIEREAEAKKRMIQDRVIVTLSNGVLSKNNGLTTEDSFLTCNQAVYRLKALHKQDPLDPKVLKWALLKPVDETDPGSILRVEHVFINDQSTAKTARDIEAYRDRGVIAFFSYFK